MFSTEERCIYRKNQLNEVICQLRFPEILTIGVNVPAAFQEAIRDEYPQYTARKEVPAPKITGTPGSFSLENAPATINYQVPDEECDLDIVPNVGRNVEIEYAMSNSLGFGGHNATIIVKKYKED